MADPTPFPSFGPSPDLRDRSTFVPRMDDTLSKLGPFSVAGNEHRVYVAGLVESARNAADAAAAAASAAATASDSALAAANFKGNWAGLTGALTAGSCRHLGQWWQLLEPIEDVTAEEPGISSKWAPLPGFGGAAGTTLAAGGTLTLSATSPRVQTVSASGFGAKIALPDARQLPEGDGLFTVTVPPGSYPVGLAAGGAVLGQILPGDTVRLLLPDNAIADGQWSVQGNLDPWWQTAETGIDAYSNPDLFPIDDDRSLLLYQNVSGYPCVRYVAHPAGGAVTVGNPYVLDANISIISGAGNVFSLLVGANRALLYLYNLRKYVLVDYSDGPALTVSTPVATGVAEHPAKVAAYDSRYVLLVMTAPSGTWSAVCLDCGASGVTLAAGAVATQSGYLTSERGLHALHVVDGATACILGYHHNGTTYNNTLRAITRSGTTLTWGAEVGNPPGLDTANPFNQVAYQVSGNTWLLFYWGVSTAGKYCVVTFGATPAWGAPVTSGLSFSSRAASIGKCGATAWVVAGTQNNPCKIEALTVSGAAITKGTAEPIDAGAASGSCSITLCSALDGKGFVSFTDAASGTMRRAAFAVSGTTVTVGSKTPVASGGYFLGATGSQYGIRESGTTAHRYVWARTYSSLVYTAAFAPLEIDANGVVTVGAFSALLPVNASDFSHAVAAAGIAGGGANQGERWRIVYRGGKHRAGRSTFQAMVSVSYTLRGGAEGLAIVSGDSRFDRNVTVNRFKFAEQL